MSDATNIPATVRLKPKLAEGLVRAAAAERRTPPDLLAIILDDWLAARRWIDRPAPGTPLPAPEPATKAVPPALEAEPASAAPPAAVATLLVSELPLAHAVKVKVFVLKTVLELEGARLGSNEKKLAEILALPAFHHVQDLAGIRRMDPQLWADEGVGPAMMSCLYRKKASAIKVAVEASKLRDMARDHDETARARANTKRLIREQRKATPIDLFIRQHGLKGQAPTNLRGALAHFQPLTWEAAIKQKTPQEWGAAGLSDANLDVMFADPEHAPAVALAKRQAHDRAIAKKRIPDHARKTVRARKKTTMVPSPVQADLLKMLDAALAEHGTTQILRDGRSMRVVRAAHVRQLFIDNRPNYRPESNLGVFWTALRVMQNKGLIDREGNQHSGDGGLIWRTGLTAESLSKMSTESIL
jgi:hypothetical protein